MNNLPINAFKSIGLLAVIATAAIGWNLAAPPAPSSSTKEVETKHATRTSRSPRSMAAENAGRRVGSLRAIADPEARLFATISLANSLSSADFASWMDGNWFTLRGGPEHLLFNRILMERWKNEDPEGLLAWAAKNGNSAGEAVMEAWAKDDPQRLIGYFKNHRDDHAEVRILSRIADSSPSIALARLLEMTKAGVKRNTEYAAGELLGVLARKAPAELAAALGSMPSGLRLFAEGAMCKERLKVSFSEEIRRLWERPDGARVFFAGGYGLDNNITNQLLGEISNLPREWHGELAMNPYRVVNGQTAGKWLDADLEGAGFSPDNIRSIRTQALKSIARQDPETALSHLADANLRAMDRKSILDLIFSSGDNTEKLRGLISQLPSEEERETATKRLDSIVSAGPETKPSNPGELFDRLVNLPSLESTYLENYVDFSNWDEKEISGLATGFKELPKEQKQAVAQVLASSWERDEAIGQLKGDAIRYLIENPVEKKDPDPRQTSAIGASANYAVRLAITDPEAAVAWVKSLPAGDAKAWTQKNLYKDWKQYDPKAAERWKKSLPAGEVNAMEKLPGG